jgi:integrase
MNAWAESMSRALVPTSPAPLVLGLAARVDRANEFAKQSRARSTRTGYAAAYARFESWCARDGFCALPAKPEVVALYLSDLAHLPRRVSTVLFALTAIAHAHRERGAPWQRHHPAVLTVMEGIRRELGVASEQKAPIVDHELVRMLEVCGDGLRAARDRALLAVGWWGAFRRAELVALRVPDLRRSAEGYRVLVARSKTDQRGQGRFKALPLAANVDACPVRLVDAWIASAGITEGAIFRGIDAGGAISAEALSGRSVALIVQRVAARAGLDAEKLAGHSLRAGFATTAALQGQTLDAIMKQTHHKDERVARGYLRDVEAFRGNAAMGMKIAK